MLQLKIERAPQAELSPWTGPRRARASGFTLLEVLVVMVIVGLLSTFVGPRVFRHLAKSRVQAAHTQIEGLRKALEHYQLDTGHAPSTAQGLAALTNRPQGEVKWDGPYMERLPLDPWQREYQYRSPGEHGEFDLYSWGRDGQPGGEGEDADITNW